MAKYMYQGSYTVEGVRGLLKETASGRRKAVEAAIVALGGKVECLYYTFGSDDVVLIMDMPDKITAAGLVMAVAASGKVPGPRTTPLTGGGGDPPPRGQAPRRTPPATHHPAPPRPP